MLPCELLSIKELDLKTGLMYCGDEEGLLDALRLFASSAEKRALALADAMHPDTLMQLSQRAHSLKSMAKLCGAVSLSDQAAALEEAAGHGDFDYVSQHTSALLAQYRALGEALQFILTS